MQSYPRPTIASVRKFPLIFQGTLQGSPASVPILSGPMETSSPQIPNGRRNKCVVPTSIPKLMLASTLFHYHEGLLHISKFILALLTSSPALSPSSSQAAFPAATQPSYSPAAPAMPSCLPLFLWLSLPLFVSSSLCLPPPLLCSPSLLLSLCPPTLFCACFSPSQVQLAGHDQSTTFSLRSGLFQMLWLFCISHLQ